MNYRQTYRQFREQGFRALIAWNYTKTEQLWEAWYGYEIDGEAYPEAENASPDEIENSRLGEPGEVRLRILADTDCSMDDLKGDVYDRAVNPEIPESRMAREEKEFEERIDREGVWGITGEFWDGDEWIFVDSCWGFVGDDFRATGYEYECKHAVLQAYIKHYTRKNDCLARELEASRPDMYCTQAI